MKKLKALARIGAFVLAVLMFVGCSAVVQNPVVAEVGSVKVRYSQFVNLFDTQRQYGLMDTSTPESLKQEHNSIFEQLVDMYIPIAAASKQGITLTEEERQEALSTAASYTDSYLQPFMDESIADEAARQKTAIKAFEKQYGISYKTSKEELEQLFLDEALGNKLTKQVTDAVPEATQDEAKAWYDEQVALERETYANDLTAYYYDTQYYTFSGAVRPLVAPEGLFYVKHILIKHEEDVAVEEEEENTLSASSEASFRDAEVVAQSILDKVRAGGDFDALIEEYGEDPGMGQEPAKSKGYVMGEGFGNIYDEAFYEAAIKLRAPGDTSGLVNSSFGYHIIRRVGDVSAEPVPFAEVEEEILNYLTNEKKNDAYNAALAQWKQEIVVKTYESRVKYVGIN